MGDLLADIEGGRLEPLYLLAGERFEVERVAAALRQAALGGEGNAFNFDSLEASVHGPEDILAAARTMPMFGARRLVQVRQVEALSTEALTKLVPYVEDPAPSTCLVLLAAKVDARTRFVKQVKKHGVFADYSPLKERQVPAWLAAEARRAKIHLDPGAAERVADAVGADKGQLASALERLALYVGPGKSVRPDDVDDLLAQTRQRSIFELTNAVGRGQRREALLVLRRMLQDRESPVRIVVMLARHLRQLWMAKELAEQGTDPKAIAPRIGVHPFFVRDMVGQARRFSRPRLARTHRALFEADWGLKSSRLPDAVVLERLVLELCPSRSSSAKS
jgi:DNA polymerase-3 subunit delta